MTNTSSFHWYNSMSRIDICWPIWNILAHCTKRQLSTKSSLWSVHSTNDVHNHLDYLMMRCESLYNDSLDTWKGKDHNIVLRPVAKPYHMRAFPIPRPHERTLGTDVYRLCYPEVLPQVLTWSEQLQQLLVLKRENSLIHLGLLHAQWAYSINALFNIEIRIQYE